VKVAVVYDGLCLFCIRSLRVLRAIDTRGRLEFHDANERDRVVSRFPVLDGVDLDAAMYAVDAGGRAYAGFYAFRRIARELPPAWLLLPLLHFPGMGFVGSRVYGLIARNRSRLGCRVDDGGHSSA
jgi:predicted DCC family thiol-disulfide oxidoreductase YuxK